jgi:hypothetical protein
MYKRLLTNTQQAIAFSGRLFVNKRQLTPMTTKSNCQNAGCNAKSIMKLLILINLLIVSLNSFGQQIHSIKKTWIDKNNRALIIQDKNLLWEKDMWLTEYDYRISYDTLFMIEYRYTSPKEHPTERPFHILKLMNDSLVLEYNKLWLGEVTKEKDTLIYIDSALIYNNNVEFKKYYFQFLICLAIRLELN